VNTRAASILGTFKSRLNIVSRVYVLSQILSTLQDILLLLSMFPRALWEDRAARMMNEVLQM